jgi:hypothetical protein
MIGSGYLASWRGDLFLTVSSSSCLLLLSRCDLRVRKTEEKAEKIRGISSHATSSDIRSDWQHQRSHPQTTIIASRFMTTHQEAKRISGTRIFTKRKGTSLLLFTENGGNSKSHLDTSATHRYSRIIPPASHQLQGPQKNDLFWDVPSARFGDIPIVRKVFILDCPSPGCGPIIRHKHDRS